MIGSLTGRLQEKGPAEILVETAGVGYRVRVPLTTYARLPERGETVTLSVHTHVREDVLALYGFDTRSERDLFECLIGVPGVGPRLGLALMSHLSPSQMAEAARARDTALLMRVPGIGPRTAERLAVELSGAFKRLPAAAVPGASAPGTADLRSDLVSALENLGYRSAQAGPVVEAILSRPGAAESPVATLIREALRELAPAGGAAKPRGEPPAPGPAGPGRRRAGGRP